MKRGAKTSKGTPAKVKGWSPQRLRQLNEIIASYGGDPAGFWQLHAHSYEHFLARRSLGELERFYSLIRSPGRTLEQIQQEITPWPKASKFEGKPPSLQVLSKIAQRFHTEATLNDVGRVAAFLERFRQRSEANPVESAGSLDSLLKILTNEIVAAKTEGMPVHAFAGSLKILLKRNEQELAARKVTLLEKKAAQADEARQALSDAKSPGELEQRIRTIFGMPTKGAPNDE